LFAAQGFSVSTRKISDAVGISQAALYKHFRSKEEIIEEVFRLRYLNQKPSDFRHLLDGSTGPLVDRLTSAYLSFFNDISETSLKLFHRASYDGLEIAKRYSPHLDEKILWPLMDNLRSEAKMAGLEQLAATRDEREVALMLHSSIVFIAIRKFVYHIDFKGTEAQVIRQYVGVWVAGAIDTIRAYHQDARD
jgi:AcrR family transcriptional regulator